jgi:phosphoenolpyruvate synthase/pyruvate phosphate dikinase
MDRKLISNKSEFLVKDGIIASPGTATGQVYSRKDWGQKDESSILYVDDLQVWDFAIVFQAVGLISSQGGVGSHIAVIAREVSCPFLIIPGIKYSEVFGRKCRIDGEKLWIPK